MEIPELNIISDFASGINSLQNPSVFPQIVSISRPAKIPQFYWLCKWGAFILTFIATFSAIITRIKLFILRFFTDKLLSSKGSPTQQIKYDYDSDEDDSCSSASSEDYEEHEPMTPVRKHVDEVSTTWACDCVGLGLDFEEESSGSVVAIWDLNKDQRINSFSGRRRQVPAVCTYSPDVVSSAGMNNKGNVLFGVHDTRVGRQIPVIHAEWRPQWRMPVGIYAGGVDKVFVMDNVAGSLMVCDMRNIKTPLGDVTECNGDAWLNSDAVIVWDEFVDGFL